MRARVLIYHDVVERGRDGESGFPSADAAAYKLEAGQFGAHLQAIAARCDRPPARAGELRRGETGGDTPWMITFDDGGASAHTRIAGLLDELGWRGHFFITTDYIGTPAFMTAPQIRDLHARGHVIGSHSCSHPMVMSRCSAEALAREWRESRKVLSDILGVAVETASVPGGYYADRVAAAAAEAGYQILFTSEPVTRAREVEGCLVLGRYSIQRRTAPDMAAGLAAGDLAPAWQQTLIWNAKKAAKRLGLGYYLKIRKSLLDRRWESAAGSGTKTP